MPPPAGCLQTSNQRCHAILLLFNSAAAAAAAAAGSPDWVCGVFSVVGDAVDWAINELIKRINIPGVESLEDLFLKAFEGFGVPVSMAVHLLALECTAACCQQWAP
jgi:hypothetical protein